MRMRAIYSPAPEGGCYTLLLISPHGCSKDGQTFPLLVASSHHGCGLAAVECSGPWLWLWNNGHHVCRYVAIMQLLLYMRCKELADYQRSYITYFRFHFVSREHGSQHRIKRLLYLRLPEHGGRDLVQLVLRRPGPHVYLQLQRPDDGYPALFHQLQPGLFGELPVQCNS